MPIVYFPSTRFPVFSSPAFAGSVSVAPSETASVFAGSEVSALFPDEEQPDNAAAAIAPINNDANTFFFIILSSINCW